jgi:hypothetical protein
LEARGGIEPPIKVLQTFALPLGYRASFDDGGCLDAAAAIHFREHHYALCETAAGTDDAA